MSERNCICATLPHRHDCPAIGYRARRELETIIYGHFHELFPNYTYIDQWCAVDLMAAEIKTLRVERSRFREALSKINFPLKHLCEDCPPDSRVDGPMAVQLANDPNYLKGIAAQAIKDTQ